MKPTQYDIARMTGLSQATISRALRGDPLVLQETRERIFAAMSDLNYRPSIGARLLAEGQRAIIGISLSRDALPTDRYVTLLHQNLLRQLDRSGWGVSLLAADELIDRLPVIGAVILIGVAEHDPRLALCRTAKVPFVAIGYALEEGVFSVVPDDAGGARLVVQHFHAMGRKRFAIMSSFADGHGPAMDRRAKAALDEAGRLGMVTTLLNAEHDVTNTLGGYRNAMRLRDQLADADCLFCDTDEHALGACAALQDMGRHIPEDITVAGFDDLPGLARDLTTVRQDFAELARQAVILCGEARAEKPPREVVVPVKLIGRGT
ncbi:MAG: LacI family DNA-binding transcriptional regulator [Paracoccaceae bacterium]